MKADARTKKAFPGLKAAKKLSYKNILMLLVNWLRTYAPSPEEIKKVKEEKAAKGKEKRKGKKKRGQQKQLKQNRFNRSTYIVRCCFFVALFVLFSSAFKLMDAKDLNFGLRQMNQDF